MSSKRYVLDPNIFVSYLITKTENKLLDIVVEKRITLFICNELIVELGRVLAYPHLKRYNIKIHGSIALVKRISVLYELIYPIKRYIPKDEKDDYLIALALQTSSGFITSGDNHILSEKNNLERKYQKLKILTKSEFEKLFP